MAKTLVKQYLPYGKRFYQSAAGALTATKVISADGNNGCQMTWPTGAATETHPN